MNAPDDRQAAECLADAGLPADQVRGWLSEKLEPGTDFAADAKKFSDYWTRSARLRKSRRSCAAPAR